MIRQIVMCGLVLGLVTSCREAAEQAVLPVQQTEKAGNTKADGISKTSAPATATVRVDTGDLKLTAKVDIPPKVKEALRAWLRDRLQDQFANLGDEIVRGTLKELSRALRTDDPVETALLAAWLFSLPRGAEAEQTEQAFDSVFLLRPATAAGEPEATVLEAEGKPVLRFTRAQADTAAHSDPHEQPRC